MSDWDSINSADTLKDFWNMSSEEMPGCLGRIGGDSSKSTLIPTSYTSPARPPYIHKKKQFSQKYVQKK